MNISTYRTFRKIQIGRGTTLIKGKACSITALIALISISFLSTRSYSQQPSGTQVSSYNFSTSTPGYPSITGGTAFQINTAGNFGATANLFTFPMPFDFYFNGKQYSTSTGTLSILTGGTGGYVHVSTATATILTTAPLTSTSASLNLPDGGLISAFGGAMLGNGTSDLTNTGTSTTFVRVGVVGAAPNRQLFIQYEHFRRTATTADDWNFNIVLNESGGIKSNQIEFNYGSMAFGTATATTRQVGLRGNTTPASGGVPSDVQYRVSTSTTAAWTTNTLGTTDGVNNPSGTAVALSSTNFPANGTTYTYSRCTTSPVYVNTFPYTQTFDGTWMNSGCGSGITQDIPDNSWRGGPLIGNMSWRRQDAGATARWSSLTSGIPSTGFTGTGYAKFHTYGGSTNTGMKGVMDLFLNLSANTFNLEFDRNNIAGTDVLNVLLSTDGGLTFPTVLGTFGTTGSSWVHSNITFSGSSTTVIRFEATSDYGFDDIAIDQVVVTELLLPPPCASNLQPANGASNQCRNITLSWNSAPGASDYDVYFGSPVAVFVQNQTGTTFTPPPPLQSNTTYQWRIVPHNANGYATGCSVQSFTTGPDLCYCTATFPSNVEPITLVQFAGISNASCAPINCGPATENFTNISGSVQKGSTYPIKVKGNTDGSYTTYIRAYIDFNQNGNFEDPGESFDLGTIANSTGLDGVELNTSITIPNLPSVLVGNTRMRIIKRFSTYAASCNTAGYGQAEDYTLNISPPPPCPLTPVGGVVSGPATACSGQPISGISVSGNAANIQWQLDGVDIPGETTSTLNFTPTTAGIYTFRNRANNPPYCTDNLSNSIIVTVNNTPIAIASVSPTDICPGETVNLAGGISPIVLSEGMNDGFPADGHTYTPTGWFQKNNSGGTGLVPNWFQGNGGGTFSPHSGAGFMAVNYNSASGANTISNWLLTPAVNLVNGMQLTFWTRTVDNSIFPDRLQVRMSTNGTSTDVGTTSTSVGDFTTLLLDINPGLTTTGYPFAWTMYTVTITGVPTAVTGRIAFRYFVTNGGPSGSNSNYIGLDDVTLLNNDISGITYGWSSSPTGFSSGSFNTSASPPGSGVYSYIFTTTKAGCSNSAVATVNIHQPTIQTSTESPYCKNDQIDFLTTSTATSAPGAPGALTVNINSTYYLDETSWVIRNSSNVIIASGGPYGYGSSNSVIVNPSPSDLPITFSIETQGTLADNIANYSVYCNASNSTLIAGTLTGGQIFTSPGLSCFETIYPSYSWTGPGGFTSSDESPSFTAEVAYTGIFYGTITDGYGCTATTSTNVVVHPNPILFTQSITPVSCLGGNDGAFQIRVTPGTGSATFNYFGNGPGSPGPIVPSNPSGNFTNRTAGNYHMYVSDVNGCVSESEWLVTVPTVPNAPPYFTSCPSNVTKNNDANQCGAVVTYALPVAADACPGLGAVVRTAGLASGSLFPIGTTVVTHMVTDAQGATATCSFSVTINDNQNPVINGLPSNIFSCNPINWSTVTVSDNCAGAQLTSTHNPGNFPSGTTTVMYTATDVYGNMATGSFTVTVKEPSIAATGAVSDRDYNNICLGENINLSVVGGSLGYNASWKWYRGSGTCGSILVGTGATINVAPTSTTTYFARAEGECNTTSCVQITVTVSTSAPSGGITYSYLPSYGAPGVNDIISINPVPGAAYYQWFTNNGHINSVLFNNSVSPVQTSVPTVNVSFVLPEQNYQIRVLAGNACGRTVQANTQIRGTVEAPTYISGPTVVCPGDVGSYTVSQIPSQTPITYVWTLTPAGAGTMTGTGLTRSILFAAGFTSAQLCVHGVSTFGLAGPDYCITISNNAPAPGAVSGNPAPCQGSSGNNYFISAVPGANSYSWSTNIVGATISGSGLSVFINYPTGAFSGNVCVQAISTCGASTPSCLAVSSGAPGVPGSINGPVNGMCGVSGNYSISAPGATDYDWQLPAGATLGSPNHASAVNINFSSGFAGGTITVVVSYSCGAANATLNVSGVPAAPTVTPATICQGGTDLYFATSPTSVNVFNWNITGSTLHNCQDGAYCSIHYIEWGPSGGSFVVTSTNNCGTSAPFSVSTNCRLSEMNQLETIVYPNPSDGKFHVEFSSVSGSSYTLTVTDLSGRIVYTDKTEAAAGVNRIELNLDMLRAGMYMLYLKNEQGQNSVNRIAIE